MPRQVRADLPDAVHHVTARANRGQVLFVDDHDRRSFLGIVGRTAGDSNWSCLAYCLMTNHLHLLVRPNGSDLSRGMQRICTAHARRFHERHETFGHLFQGRFGSRPMRSEAHFLESLRYVVLNPVRAGMCRVPEQYPWSSHRSVMGAAQSSLVAVDEVLQEFRSPAANARDVYREFVHERCGERAPLHDPEPLYAPEDDDSTRRLDELCGERDRDGVIMIGHVELGYSLAEIARALGCHRSTVSRRFEVLSRRATHGV